MQLDALPDPQSTGRRRPLLETLLLLGFVTCLVIGVVAFVAFFTLYNEDTAADNAGNLQETIRPAQIVPQLALRSLAGDPAGALAHQAVTAGELETASATILFDPSVPPATQANILAQLLRRAREQGELGRIAALAKIARAVAVLAPSLNSYDRSQLLLQAAEALLAAGEDPAALDAALQAQRMASQAPDLLPAQRSQVFESLRTLSRSLDDPDFAQQVTELARNPYLAPAGALVSDRLLTLAQPLEPDPALEAAIATRQATARQLADRLAFTQGVDVEPERQALAMALLAEDQVRAQRLQGLMAGGISLQQQLSLLLDQQAWHVLKARVAQQGFGLGLVPDWEANADPILQELTAVTANLGAVYDALANAQPTPEEQAMLRAEALQRLALEQELGRLQAPTPAELGSRLQYAQAELARLGLPLALPVGYEEQAVPPGYRVQAVGR